MEMFKPSVHSAELRGDYPITCHYVIVEISRSGTYFDIHEPIGVETRSPQTHANITLRLYKAREMELCMHGISAGEVR